MTKIEFEAERKNFGSSFVITYDEVNETFADKSSILIQRKRFNNKDYPKRIKVTVEWVDEQ